LREEGGGGLFIQIGLGVRMDVDDEGGTDDREQARLSEVVGESG